MEPKLTPSLTMPTISCPLEFQSNATFARRGEPVTIGLPWSRGTVKDERLFRLIGPDGAEQVLQTQVLDRWSDGTVRWCLFDFLATWDGTTRDSGYRIELGNDPRQNAPNLERTKPRNLRFAASINSNQVAELAVQGLEVAGPVRRRWKLAEQGMESCRLFGYLDEFAGTKTVRIQLTIQNPQPADHPGGNWDLGNGGSVNLQFFNVYLDPDDQAWEGVCRLSAEIGAAWMEAKREQRLHQHSSGGVNWNSSNHLDRNRQIPFDQRGYTVSNETGTVTGLRATPIATLENRDQLYGVAVPYFWQNFPMALISVPNSLTLQLVPSPTELQGGEQKTHTFYLAYGKDTITDEPMVWCRSPIVAHASPEWYAASGALPYLTPRASDPHGKYLGLVDQAIEGPDSFLHKRERIDEYGWRNFGDVYGDHEAVYHKGPAPLISHYNNQYDCVLGFLAQFFRSGDLRWLSQGLECADHTSDIDIYHTDGDKAAYNRGLFWHTYHYADADTGTHRAYPKSITRGPTESLTTNMTELGETAKQLKKSYAVGGGPSASHNYNAGLMYAYFLTGNPLYRDSALDLANFVFTMEDPSKTPFRFLSSESTGLATESGGGGYQGPGRASANSILALLVGHRLTGQRRYLEKAEQLIRRVVHPKQDLESLDLLNAELRWFYTMTLQALGEYLDVKAELNELDEHYLYARLTLLHYARWMAEKERPILDTPERLQYPTESWAAQDMRKVEVFQFAAKHATGEERARFLERAEWFFQYVQNTLPEFPTKSLCRPVILMMRYGWSRNWWRLNSNATAPEPNVRKSADQFGNWTMFVPQKVRAIRRAKRIVIAGAFIASILIAYLVWSLVG